MKMEKSGLMEKELPLSSLVFPPQDLRFYRSREFIFLLANDIKANGLKVPPIVTHQNGFYLILDGVNRVKAVKLLKWKSIRCDIVSNLSDPDKIILGLSVNYFRSSHDPMGFVSAFDRLRKMGLKQKDIAKRFQMSKGHVSKLLSLTKLSPEDQLKLAKNEISIEEAYFRVKKPRDPDLMEKLNIKYECSGCHRKTDFSQIIEARLCLDCEAKLKDLIKKERERLKRERGQTGL
jgi:ParB/RepB/Spo0J family partition protein